MGVNEESMEAGLNEPEIETVNDVEVAVPVVVLLEPVESAESVESVVELACIIGQRLIDAGLILVALTTDRTDLKAFITPLTLAFIAGSTPDGIKVIVG